jgi:hypothetical protein
MSLFWFGVLEDFCTQLKDVALFPCSRLPGMGDGCGTVGDL